MPRFLAVQTMYLQSVDDIQSLHRTRSAQLNAKLDELATTEVLALSRPPASFPLPESHADTQGQTASSLTALRRELAFKQQALDDALRARDEAAEKLECSEVCLTFQLGHCLTLTITFFILEWFSQNCSQ
jgi:hypothetical protein